MPETYFSVCMYPFQICLWKKGSHNWGNLCYTYNKFSLNLRLFSLEKIGRHFVELFSVAILGERMDFDQDLNFQDAKNFT